MKLYQIARARDGNVQLTAQAEVIDKDSRGRSIGAHIETEITSKGYALGDDSPECHALALTIMNHYYDASLADAGATAEAARKAPLFHGAFLLNATVPVGGFLEISSTVLDKWTSLLVASPTKQ